MRPGDEVLESEDLCGETIMVSCGVNQRERLNKDDLVTKHPADCLNVKFGREASALAHADE